MRNASARARRARRDVRLEFLEDRNLLSVFSPQSLAGEVSTPRPIDTITGRVQGLPATAGLYTPTLPGHVSFSGHGAARPVGDVLFSVQQVNAVSGSTLTITRGGGQIYDYRGNQLFVVYTGSGTIPARGPVHVTLTGTVTSGTRRFLGETGTFTATGTLARSTGRLAADFTIVFNHPA